MENALAARLELAKQDRRTLNALVTEYTPFIKKSVSAVYFKSEARRDALTDAMLAFAHAVQTYDAAKGSFVGYAGTAIRNRLIDMARREGAAKRRLFAPARGAREDGEPEQWERDAAQRQYDIEEERRALAQEIDEVNTAFAEWGFDWNKLVKKCPKQERSRSVCHAAARAIMANPALAETLVRTKQLPAAELAGQGGFPRKALEKYRPYIIALTVLARGAYPYVRAYMPRLLGESGEEWEEMP